MFAHTFRFDGDVHVMVTSRRNVRRGRNDARAICGARIRSDAVRVTSVAATSCAACVRGFTGFENAIDTDFGFTITHDDGTGRFVT